MSQENERAAQRAHRNVGLPDEEYDDEGKPAAARAREPDRPEPRERATRSDDESSGTG